MRLLSTEVSSGLLNAVKLRKQNAIILTVFAALAILVASPANATIKETVLYNFPTQSFGNPSGLIADAQGDYFGSISGGVYEFSSGGVFSTLHAFQYGASIIFGPDGKLYGDAQDSSDPDGLVFSMATDGSDYTVIHSFDGTDGQDPFGLLAFGNGGSLYGLCAGPGSANAPGILYKIDTTGRFTTVHTFSGGTAGEEPRDLVSDNHGSIYGVTEIGGTENYGLIYQLRTVNEQFIPLFSFDGSDGKTPNGPLTKDSQGNLYGLTDYRSKTADGSIYQFSPSNSLTVLHTFTGSADSGYPLGAVEIDPDGNLFSTTAGVTYAKNGGTIFIVHSDGTYSILYTFRNIPSGGDNSNPTGADPTGYFVFDGKGDLIGTTGIGGTDGFGVIYSLAILPNIAHPASAMIDQSASEQIDLSTLGSDDAYNESELKYQWIGSGPSKALFSSNRSNASKQTQATVSAEGVYTFTVKIINPLGGVKTSKVSITVS